MIKSLQLNYLVFIFYFVNALILFIRWHRKEIMLLFKIIYSLRFIIVFLLPAVFLGFTFSWQLDLLKEIQNALLSNRASLVHAAGLSNTFGEAVLICGKGGIGKTTTAAYFVSRGNWKIIGDDFVIVSEEGKIYRSNLPAHIYGYHIPIITQMGIQDDELFRGWLDKLQWNIYSLFKSPAGVVRRVHLPTNIMDFSGSIKVCFIVEISGSDHREISIQHITPEEAAYLSNQYTLSEMNIMNDSQRESLWMVKKQQIAIEILSKAFYNAVCYKLVIPENYKGYTMAQIIWNKVAELLTKL